jgi:formate hydrogenlyase subunit 6/NADH:ubiquinone oxidoreductase subunit I
MGLIGFLLKIARSGPVTEAYPGEVILPDRGLHGTPVLDPDACDLAAACEAACPTRAISIHEADAAPGAWQIDYGLCIFCGACIQACPNQAIVVSNDFELAARHRVQTTSKRFPAVRRV